MRHTLRPAWVVLLGSVLLLASCQEEKVAREWIEGMEPLLTDALAQVERHPYQEEQQLAFKAYFGELQSMAVRLSGEPKLSDGLNKALSKLDLNEACARILIPRADWHQIVASCTRNSFFLCSEEIRFYPEIVASLQRWLTEENLKRFHEARNCQGP